MTLFHRCLLISTVTLCLLPSLSPAVAVDQKLKGIACRSVHLGYQKVPDSLVFYNEVQVQSSAEGTYFCVCGFSQGYFGLQELSNRSKVILFSVWDPGDQNDPNSVRDEQRVKLLHNHPDVRVKRFGNEGTGGQSFLDFDWKVGETYRFAVAAKRSGDRTEYSSWFFHPADNAWRHLVTFSTLTKDTSMKGYYAFVEDFQRNRVSTTKTRKAVFSNPAVLLPDGQWQAVTSARFTADSNPVLNIDSGLAGDQFWIATGGQIENSTVQLNGLLNRQDVPTTAPTDLQPLVQQWLDMPRQ